MTLYFRRHVAEDLSECDIERLGSAVTTMSRMLVPGGSKRLIQVAAATSSTVN